MAVITFSTSFPSYHSKAGQPTFFVEKFLKAWDMTHSFEEIAKTPLIDARLVNNKVLDTCLPKYHTIRKGQRFKEGDIFSPRIWGTDINPKSGRTGPYHSKQIIIAPDTLITKTYDFEINGGEFKINDRVYGGETESIFELLELIAMNDGLDRHDLMGWFKYPKPFKGQIICWNKNIKY